MNAIRNLRNDDRGYRGLGLIESLLLVAFVALGSSAIFLKAQSSASKMWISSSDCRLIVGATTAGE